MQKLTEIALSQSIISSYFFDHDRYRDCLFNFEFTNML